MNAIIKLGKYFFLLPFLAFGVMHLASADSMSGMVPAYMPGGVLWVYISGIGMALFAVSILIGKYDKLAAILAVVLLLLYIVIVHIPSMATNQMAMVSILKDLGLCGACLMYADKFAKDASIIG